MKKVVLTCLIFLISLGFGQRELTSYQSNPSNPADEFPTIVAPIWNVKNSKVDCYSRQAAIGKINLFYIDSGVLKARNIKTGEQSWQLENVTCGGYNGFPLALNYEKGLVFIIKEGSLYALHEDTGMPEWSYTFRSNQGINIFTDEGVVFATWAENVQEMLISISEEVMFDAKSGEIIWRASHEANTTTAQPVYRSFRLLGNTIVLQYHPYLALYDVVDFRNLQTGEQLWGFSFGSRMDNRYLVYMDDKYVYLETTYSQGPSYVGPIMQLDIRTGKVLKECDFNFNPRILSQRYETNNYPFEFPIDPNQLRSDGKWLYALVDRDIHRFPLCGVTRDFPESLGQSLTNDMLGQGLRYELPTLLFTWIESYGYDVVLPNQAMGSDFYGKHELGWIAGPVEGTFVFYSSSSKYLYGIEEHDIPTNYVDIFEDMRVYPKSLLPKEIKQYVGIISNISRLDIIDGMVFVGTVDGGFHVFDLHTQEVIFRTRVNSPNFAPFHLVDDIAIVQTLNGDVMAFKLDLPKQEPN